VSSTGSTVLGYPRIGPDRELKRAAEAFWAARSRMEVLADLGPGIPRGLGPGVYDVHSPEVPDADEFAAQLTTALRHIGPDRLWANPDCGLKTRGEPETVAALTNLVAAARRVRDGAR